MNTTRTPMPRLLVATHNCHKTEEIRAILRDSFEVSDLTAHPEFPVPEETGTTFAENASIKALAASAALGSDAWVLADDSGLEVDALGGAPGVQSALYSGSHGDHAGHRTKLLAELARLGPAAGTRRARFRCVLVLARKGRIEADFHGAVEGRIADQEKGCGGFGYDPLFQPDGHDRTFGELSASVKNGLSHRARALAAFRTWWDSQPRDT